MSIMICLACQPASPSAPWSSKTDTTCAVNADELAFQGRLVMLPTDLAVACMRDPIVKRLIVKVFN